jgi:hypothetical protein
MSSSTPRVNDHPLGPTDSSSVRSQAGIQDWDGFGIAAVGPVVQSGSPDEFRRVCAPRWPFSTIHEVSIVVGRGGDNTLVTASLLWGPMLAFATVGVLLAILGQEQVRQVVLLVSCSTCWPPAPCLLCRCGRVSGLSCPHPHPRSTSSVPSCPHPHPRPGVRHGVRIRCRRIRWARPWSRRRSPLPAAVSESRSAPLNSLILVRFVAATRYVHLMTLCFESHLATSPACNNAGFPADMGGAPWLSEQ